MAKILTAVVDGKVPAELCVLGRMTIVGQRVFKLGPNGDLTDAEKAKLLRSKFLKCIEQDAPDPPAKPAAPSAAKNGETAKK